MAKFAINAMLLPNLIQVTESISGSVVPLAMFIIHVDNLNMLDAGRNYSPGLLLSKRVRNDWWLK